MVAKSETNAKKETYKKADALKLAKKASELFVAKGKNVVHVNLKKDVLSDDEIAKLMLGPTGNLRAPTLQLGKKLIIGFNEEMYEQNLK